MKRSVKLLKKTEADILPLMDCMFILLVYFIFTLMMFVTAETIPMKLPKVDNINDSKLTYYSVVILKGGEILFNRNKIPISINELTGELQSLIDQGIKPKIFLETKPGSEFVYFIDVLDVFRTLKLKSVSVETDVKLVKTQKGG